MAKSAVSVLVLAVLVAPAFADNPDAPIWRSVAGCIDTGWTVSIPTLTSDFANQAHVVNPGTGTSDGLVAGLAVRAIAIAVADFGGGQQYTTVGLYPSNLPLDPSGNTPDLNTPITATNPGPFSPAPPPLFHYYAYDLTPAAIPSGSTRVHTVCQWPFGDSGTLATGADTSLSATGMAGFTSDGYTTPAVVPTFLDWGMNPGQDNSGTQSCRPVDRRPHGRLFASRNLQGVGSGDHLTIQLRSGDPLNLAFFGTKPGDKWRFYLNSGSCNPAVPIGPALSTKVDPDGIGSFRRINAFFPPGFGGNTFRFSAAWGNASCLEPGAGFTNCVTLIVASDLPFGQQDDGTVESPWLLQIPSGPLDFFNVNLGDGTGQPDRTKLSVAPADFVTAVPAYPAAGVSNANLLLDPTGNTPDLSGSGLLALVAPFTFPSGTVATTSGQYVVHAISVPSAAMSSNVHVWTQLPPGDSGFLAIGADTSDPGCTTSFVSFDGYATPALLADPNWALQAKP